MVPPIHLDAGFKFSYKRYSLLKKSGKIEIY